MQLIESYKSETYLYASVDEKVIHKVEMLSKGWDVDGESFGETISVTYVKGNN